MILDFVVKTIPTVALGIVLSIGAVYLIDKYLGPIGNPLSQLCQPLTYDLTAPGLRNGGGARDSARRDLNFPIGSKDEHHPLSRLCLTSGFNIPACPTNPWGIGLAFGRSWALNGFGRSGG